jgi:hypothetical protein
MSAQQVAANASAVRNLAETLQRWGLTDPEQRAEHLTTQLARDGWKPLEPPPPHRGPGASEQAREDAMRVVREAVREAKVSGGRA